VQAVLVSYITVALAEFGDKTQLLAIVLASRFKKPLPIIAGIFTATVLNHLLAATGGYYLADFFGGFWFRLIIALSFVAMGITSLIPDKSEFQPPIGNSGAYLTTLLGIFVLEVGDKMQIATIALAARFHSILLVAIGTTLGMLSADIPAVFLAERATTVVPLRVVRFVAALIFLALGAWGVIEMWK
jgi:putative Ca2+/H+ antiporter (TMEM165/GDT1 family)